MWCAKLCARFVDKPTGTDTPPRELLVENLGKWEAVERHHDPVGPADAAACGCRDVEVTFSRFWWS